jgi:hypothetical protein
VRELLSSLDSYELSEWAAFYAKEPFGEYRADIRSAQIANILANTNRGKDTEPFTLYDFMPFVPKPVEKEKANVNVAKFKAMFAHRVKKNGKPG